MYASVVVPYTMDTPMPERSQENIPGIRNRCRMAARLGYNTPLEREKNLKRYRLYLLHIHMSISTDLSLSLSLERALEIISITRKKHIVSQNKYVGRVKEIVNTTQHNTTLKYREGHSFSFIILHAVFILPNLSISNICQ